MRILKFRAWDTFTNKMYKHNDIPDSGHLCHILDPNQRRYIYMQFTGLSDKNGVKIYEGDIVKCHDTKPESERKYYNNIVEWFESMRVNGWRIKGANNGRYTAEIRPHMIINMGFEVIGNIYENPELLSDKSNSKE